MAQISVDFQGVEAGGSSPRIPEGDYGFKIIKVVSKKAKESGNPLLLFSLKAVSGNPAGLNKILLHNCTLTKNSLWNLRNLLEATGKTVPPKAIKIDLDKLVGLGLAGTVIDDAPYKGKTKSIVSAFFPLADLNKPADDDVEGEPGEEDTGEDATDESSDDSEAEDLFE